MENVWSMTMETFCFAKNAIFSKVMSQSKDLFWLIQAPNISKHISRNGGATVKASQKNSSRQSFLFSGKKAGMY